MGWPPAPQPGIIPLRPLGVSDLLNGAVRLVTKYPRVVLPPAAIASVITSGAGALLQLRSRHDQADGTFSGWTALTLLGTGAASLIVASILTGVLSHAVSDAVLGRTPTLGDAWGKARPQIWRLGSSQYLSCLSSLSDPSC
jgi:hypothetical protein